MRTRTNPGFTRRGFGLVELLVIIAIIAMLLALLIPAVQKVREAATRTQSTNHLKQIALSMHGFHDSSKRLPFNGSDAMVGKVKYTKDAQAEKYTSGSWGFQVLPFMDHLPLFDKPSSDVGIPSFMCPGRGRPSVEFRKGGGGAWSDYFLNNYLNNPAKAETPDNPDMKRTFVGITDGSSNTVFAGHGNIEMVDYKSDSNVAFCSTILTGGTTGTIRAGKNGVANPAGASMQRDSTQAPTLGSWGGPFPQGGLMSMCDGTVRMFPYGTQNLANFLTPNGAEVTNLPD
ncbi:MAG: DUF1559 domain-containing protein [Gemmataceae bacterium]|nr:DUF1559 domain-containing protein [Gemmataceae bacterium]